MNPFDAGPRPELAAPNSVVSERHVADLLKPARDRAAIDVELATLDAELSKLMTDARALLEPIKSGKATPGQVQAMDQLRAGYETRLSQRAALLGERADALAWAAAQSRRAAVAALAANPAAHERPFAPQPRKEQTTMNTSAAGQDYARLAFAAIERSNLAPAAQDRLDRVIRSEPVPAHSRYLAAIGSPEYLSAFAALMADESRAALELAPEERAALREARDAQRTLTFALGGDPGGLSTGWPLPMTVDPTLSITGDGSANPLRRFATVRTVATKTLTVTSAAQVAAGYGAEGSDVAEVAPDMTPTKITAERGAAFVRLTYELLSDFAGATGEIARLFSDARDNLEAAKFAVGTGSDEPAGIITGLTPFDAAPAAVADLLAVQADLGARYQANARWLAPLAVLNAIGQYVAAADASNAPIIDGAGNLLRKPQHEVSFMTAGDLIYGDIRAGFTILDRIGMSVEPTGATFNIATGVPDGNRGFLCIWRSGSGVTDTDALRLLAGA